MLKTMDASKQAVRGSCAIVEAHTNNFPAKKWLYKKIN